MSFVTQVKLLLQPIIFLYKFLFGRRISDTSNNNNSTSHQPPDVATTSIVSYDSGEYSDPLPLPTGEYEVFLSFRGPDTRHQLTDILYRFLVHLKIRTFRDDDELRQGEGIWSNLVRAIGQSKVYIPILSETYAHSKWCLEELAEIVECQKQNKGHIILPIFYMVDPRDVRHQTGPYQSAFQEHEKKFDAKTIQVWRHALVGTLKGWHVKSKDETKPSRGRSRGGGNSKGGSLPPRSTSKKGDTSKKTPSTGVTRTKCQMPNANNVVRIQVKLMIKKKIKNRLILKESLVPLKLEWKV